MIDSTFRKMLARAGKEAKLDMPIHPHMLRHSTGFKLANEGRNTRSIQHIICYTDIMVDRFKDFWPD